MTDKEKQKFKNYLRQRYSDISDQKLLCIISTPDEKIYEYLKNRYPDYDFLLQVEKDIQDGKIQRDHVDLLIKKLYYIQDMFPSQIKAIIVFKSKYGNNFPISCPLMKTNDGKLKPLYQLENFDWD